MSLSVVIPTFNNVDFLPELIDSIINNEYQDEFEILIGIDGCKTTLEYINNNQFPDNFKFFYFLENKGPYLIKNTLCEISKYDKILFFDSDDIMLNKTLSEIDENLDRYDVIKPKYINFEDKENGRVFDDKRNQFGEGVFGIKKDLFLGLNGFEGWKVAADSDFMGRLYKTNVKILHTPYPLFHRRVHNDSLTVHPDTGLKSKLRGYYVLKSRKKTKDHIVNETLQTSQYVTVDFNGQDPSVYNLENNITNENCPIERKKQQYEFINTIFNPAVKVMKSSDAPKTINYQQVNIQTNHRHGTTQLTNALKKAKLENLQNRNRRR